jgi:hypothetical protein
MRVHFARTDTCLRLKARWNLPATRLKLPRSCSAYRRTGLGASNRHGCPPQGSTISDCPKCVPTRFGSRRAPIAAERSARIARGRSAMPSALAAPRPAGIAAVTAVLPADRGLSPRTGLSGVFASGASVVDLATARISGCWFALGWNTRFTIRVGCEAPIVCTIGLLAAARPVPSPMAEPIPEATSATASFPPRRAMGEI